MEDRTIDFSDMENEYLPGDLIKKTVGIAFGTGLIGLILSSLLFWERGLGGTADVLDRRGAEVGNHVSSSERLTGEGPGSVAASGFRNSRRPTLGEQPDRDAWKRFLHLAVQPEPEPENAASTTAETAERSRAEPTSVVLEDTPSWQARPRKRQPPRTPSPAKVAPAAPARDEVSDRLLYPAAASRPPVLSETVRQDLLMRSTLLLLDSESSLAGAVVLSGGRTALTTLSSWTPGVRVRSAYDGRSVGARLLRADPEYDLALIEIDGVTAPGLPLAPAPPTLGEAVLSGSPIGSRFVAAPGRAAGSFDTGGFLLEGPLSLTSGGSGIVNSRGELVGCVIASISGLPGTGLHIVADSAVLNRLVSGYDGRSERRDSSSILRRAIQHWGARQSAQLSEVKRGRVIPGLGVSDLHLGMSSAQAQRWVSGSEVRTLPYGLVRWDSPAPPLSLVFADDRLVLIASRNPGYATPSGLSLGALLDAPALSRHSKSARLFPGLVMLEGLEVWLDGDSRVREFVVRESLR